MNTGSKSNVEHIQNELNELVRMFDIEDNIELFYDVDMVRVSIGEVMYSYSGRALRAPIGDAAHGVVHVNRKLLVRTCKLALYYALKTHLQRDLPWGALTGIRPTKMVYELLAEQDSLFKAQQILTEDYFVSTKKAWLVCEVVKNQQAVLSQIAPKKQRLVNLYVHIPFCPTRCRYCSFLSLPIQKHSKLVAPYIKKLREEIELKKREIKASGQEIFSVYIGGGTPTALSVDDLESVLKALGKPNAGTEFTVEAGRPDTIDVQKLQLLKAYGVSRVSVNPQSLKPQTLEAIGRAHTVEDFYSAYDLSKVHGFNINVDLIAGLEGETLDDFLSTLEGVVALKPHNITVHTLCAKRGAELKALGLNADIDSIIDSAIGRLELSGYNPYYLYRQKKTLGNLENIGFSLAGFECSNNISVMEEVLPVVGLGAGAISKSICHKTNLITRNANPKDVHMYLTNK